MNTLGKIAKPKTPQNIGHGGKNRDEEIYDKLNAEHGLCGVKLHMSTPGRVK